MTMNRVIIYARISKELEDDSRILPTDRQEAACRSQCEALGWSVVDVLTDEISGWSGVTRPGFNRLKNLVSNRECDVVMVWKLDRLSRRVKEVIDFTELITKNEVHLRTVVDGIDTSGPNGNFILKLMSLLSELESDQISMRVKAAFSAKAKAGDPHVTGNVPFGFESDHVTHNDHEASALREAVYGLLNESKPVSRSLKARGYDLNSSRISGIMRNPRYAGFRIHGDELFPGNWEPIIELDQWKQLQRHYGSEIVESNGRMIVRHSKKTSTQSVRRHLLTELLICEICGCKLSHTGPKEGRYNCPNSCTTIDAEFVETLVVKDVLQVRGGISMMGHDRNEESKEDIEKEIQLIEERMQKLSIRYFVQENLTEGEFEAAREALRAALDELLGKLSTLNRMDLSWSQSGSRRTLDQWWEAASLTDKRLMLASVIERVTIRVEAAVRAELQREYTPWSKVKGKRALVMRKRVIIEYRDLDHLR